MFNVQVQQYLPGCLESGRTGTAGSIRRIVKVHEVVLAAEIIGLTNQL